MTEFNSNNTVGFLLQTMLYLSNHTPTSTVFKELTNTQSANNPGKNANKSFSKKIIVMRLKDIGLCGPGIKFIFRKIYNVS